MEQPRGDEKLRRVSAVAIAQFYAARTNVVDRDHARARRSLTSDLITRARTVDGEAFRELTEPYRRELQVHCYRMLGSFHDAEDALQEALLAAWQGLASFEGRASMRTWALSDRHPLSQCAALGQPARRQGVGHPRG